MLKIEILIYDQIFSYSAVFFKSIWSKARRKFWPIMFVAAAAEANLYCSFCPFLFLCGGTLWASLSLSLACLACSTNPVVAFIDTFVVSKD